MFLHKEMNSLIWIICWDVFIAVGEQGLLIGYNRLYSEKSFEQSLQEYALNLERHARARLRMELHEKVGNFHLSCSL